MIKVQDRENNLTSKGLYRIVSQAAYQETSLAIHRGIQNKWKIFELY
jgi:hypothetical protein